MKNILITFLFLSLLGCAAALVPESNSPRAKIDQATALFNQQGRQIGAEKLLLRAIELAKEQKDTLSEADAEFYLGEILKSPGSDGHMLENPKAALVHLNRAIELYIELKLYKKAAFVSWSSAGAHEKIPDAKGRCKALREAAKLHEKPGADQTDVLPPAYANGNLLKSIEFQIKKHKCA
jgi:hypothetical protein